MLDPFTLKPIFEYTFTSVFGKHTNLGSEYLSIMIYNLFISEPKDAIQDVLEVNFGFEVTSVAGMTVEKQHEELQKTHSMEDIARIKESQ